MHNSNKKGRTLKVTVDDIFQSKRLELALHLADVDKSFLKAIFIELGMEAQSVTKNSIIRAVSCSEGLDKFELKPYLASINSFTTYNMYFSQFCEVGRQYYMKDPHFQITDPVEKKKILKEIEDKLNNKGDS